MAATKIELSKEQTDYVNKHMNVYRNEGTSKTGRWVYQPWNFDSSFALWSDGFLTRREATAAAFLELSANDLAGYPAKD